MNLEYKKQQKKEENKTSSEFEIYRI